jgi:hypothetical protein
LSADFDPCRPARDKYLPMGDLPPPPSDGEDYYRICRGQIEHEDDLIGQRLNWFLASQSFMFTAYAIVLSNTRAAGASALVDWDTRLLLLRAIPAIAIVSAVMILLAIVSGFVAMADVRRLAILNVPEPVRLRLPPLQGRSVTRALGIAAPFCLPVVFAVVWVLILVNGR